MLKLLRVSFFFLFGTKAAKYQPSGGRCEHAEGAEQGETQSQAPCIGIRRHCLPQLCCTHTPIFSACSRTSTRRGVGTPRHSKCDALRRACPVGVAPQLRGEAAGQDGPPRGATASRLGSEILAAEPPQVLRCRALENASTAFLITRRAR